MDASVQTSEAAKPPVGGHRLSLALLSAAHAEQHALAAIQPMIFPYLMSALGFDYATLGLILLLANLVGGMFQGIHSWTSRFIRRKWLIATGSAGMSLSLALVGLAGSLPQLAGALMFGKIASSPQHPMANSLMADWYAKEKRGGAFSIHFSGGNVGAIVVPLLAGFLISRWGWHTALLAVIVPGVIVATLVMLFMDDARRPRRSSPAATAQSAARQPFWSPLKNPQIRTVILARSIASGGRGLGVIMVFVPMYLSQSLHLSPIVTGSLYTLMMIGSVVGPLTSGRLSDRWGRKQMIIGSFALSALATVGLVAAGASLPLVTAALALLGLCVYNESPLMQTLLADVTHAGTRDQAFSLFYVLGYAAGAGWAGVLGWVINSFGFHVAFMLMTLSYILAGMTTAGVRQTPTGLSQKLAD